MTNKIKRLLMFMLAFTLLVTTYSPIPMAASRDVKAGTLTMLQGDVYVSKGGGNREIRAFEGMGVTEGDHIRTAKDASVKVILSEENELLLGANTKILISEFMENNTVIKQKSGSLWNKVKSLFNIGDRFEVETPTSIMGVRGTHFYVQVDQETDLKVFDGRVNIQRPISTGDFLTHEEEVGIDLQIQTQTDRTLSASAPLNIRQFVQEADDVIIVQVILDELEASEDRERKARDFRESDNWNEAVEEAHLASLLAHIAQAIMRETEQSPRYQDVWQAFDDRGISWEQTKQQVRHMVGESENTKEEINRAAEQYEARELQDKINRYRSDVSTPPANDIPIRPPSSDDEDDDDENTPPDGTTVTATFENGWAEVRGVFNEIAYTLSIPQLPGDGETIHFTLHDPPDIRAEVGPVHALDIVGLENREVELTLDVPQHLSDQPQAYHDEGDGRWEPRDTIINQDGTVTFTTTLSAVAVAAMIPSPMLEGITTSITDQQYNLQIGWSEIEMEGVGYELYRSSDDESHAEAIWSTTDSTENRYIDTVAEGRSYTYTVKAVRAGFESYPSHEVRLPMIGTISGEVTSFHSPDQQPLADITIKVWDENREQIIARGTTDVAGQYSQQVPIGGPYRITAEYIEEAGHAFEMYDGHQAVADLFLRHEGFHHSDPYTFSVQEEDEVSIPAFAIVPYERIEHLTGEESTHAGIFVTWEAYAGADFHRVYIFGSEYASAPSGFSASAQPETLYEFGVAAWKDGVPLAIGYIEFTTDRTPITGTVTGSVYHEEEGCLANIPIKVWDLERTALVDIKRTDGEGQFTLPFIPIGENAYRITAEYEGQAYELRYDSVENEYLAMSSFTEPASSPNYPPYTFSIYEDEETDIGDIVLRSDPAGPTAQLEHFSVFSRASDSITVRWENEQISDFDRYRIFVNGELRAEIDENHLPFTTFTVEDLLPTTFYEIAVGVWETNADRAAAAATLIERTNLPWQ